jgi:TRAP-type uncharacterized transport system fused permease subunit
MFVLSPELLMIDTTWYYLIWVVFTALAGMMLIGAGIIGFWLRKLFWYERLIGVVGGLMLIYPEKITDIIGLGSFVLIIALQLLIKRNDTAETSPAS